MGAPYRWTQERIDFIRDNIAGTPYKDMTEMVNERFGEPYISQYNLKALLAKMGWANGRDCRFKPGMASHNKGKSPTEAQLEAMRPTQFKPGQRPWNWKPVGSERVNVDGYIEVKVAEPKTWKLLHRVVWEEANGPIPKDCCVIFKDRNPLNCELDNLMMIRKAENSILNIYGWHKEDPELTETGVNVAKLMNETKKRRKKCKREPAKI